MRQPFDAYLRAERIGERRRGEFRDQGVDRWPAIFFFMRKETSTAIAGKIRRQRRCCRRRQRMVRNQERKWPLRTNAVANVSVPTMEATHVLRCARD